MWKWKWISKVENERDLKESESECSKGDNKGKESSSEAATRRTIGERGLSFCIRFLLTILVIMIGVALFWSRREQIMRRVANLNKEQTLGLWHDMLEHGDGHHEGEEEGKEVEHCVKLQGSLQLHLFHLHLGALCLKRYIWGQCLDEKCASSSFILKGQGLLGVDWLLWWIAIGKALIREFGEEGGEHGGVSKLRSKKRVAC